MPEKDCYGLHPGCGPLGGLESALSSANRYLYIFIYFKGI